MSHIRHRMTGANAASQPQAGHHRHFQALQVDFGEVWVKLAGVRTKCQLFTFRLSFCGKAVHRVFASGEQEAFFEGHVHAFSVLGGIPTGKVRYDNLRPAVRQVLGCKPIAGGERALDAVLLALRRGAVLLPTRHRRGA